MSTFFTELADMLADRQELRIHITKIGDDLVTLTVPNFKDEGKHITLSGSPAELDAEYMDRIKKPITLSAGKLTSNAEEVAEEMEEEIEENTKKKSSKKPDPKKEEKKKAEAKKPDPKPAAEKKNVADVVQNVKTNKEEKQEQQSDQDAPFLKLMQEGQSLMDAEKYQDAEKIFDQALQLKPEDPEALKQKKEANRWSNMEPTLFDGM